MYLKRAYLALLFIVCLLTACSLKQSAVLPTMMPTAQLLGAVGAASSGGASEAAPPTYTPGASLYMQVESVWHPIDPNTPSPHPTMPTSTPRPPTATPTPTVTPTPLVTPTPTRYVSIIPYNLPPTDELGPSKMGLHVIQNNNPLIMDFVRQAQPAVMKAVGDFGFLKEVKEVSPRTITIGRFPASHQNMTGNPEEAARQFVEEQLRYYELNPWVDYWEGWNEPDPNMDKMSWYARFEQERVRVMAQHGYRAAIGGFAAGVPEMDEFALFIPAIETAIQHRGIMTLHEYGAPTLDYLYGAALPGYPSYPDRGALAFRYRWFYKEYLEPAGLVIPLVISEMGIDGIIGNRPGPAGLGWREFQSFWKSEGRWGTEGVAAYINQLAWYDAGIRQDGYVIGFTIFTAGGGERWESYDVNDILPQLAGYARSQW